MRTLTATLFTFIVFLSYANVQRPKADRKTNPPTETKKRNTDHIDDILLRPDPIGYDDNDPNIKAVLKELRTIYQNMIRPVEKQFRYADLRRHTMTDVDIYAKPIILLVGPWSTGKSTMINYLLGIEGALESLYVGAEPTTGDFTVLSYGEEYRTVEGVVLATDATKPFASMEKFGQIFLEHLLGVEMNRPLLRNISFIDTPGILENRRQQERGYPYNDVMRWLVHRSDLIFVVFDPTKLDVGYELETLFKQLKGKESVLRIILNKADSMSEQDLMRVYGALFWSLSPLINVTEPPRVYVGSFWGEPFHDDDLAEILLREEKSLLHDMREVVRNRVYNKIAFVRQYAIRVRIHALLVDSYVAAYRRNKGLFGGSDELARQIVEDPESYDVFKTVLSHPNISKYDLPEPEEYEEFFRINPLADQRRISEHCGYFSGCAIDELNRAISTDLPILLRRFRTPNERRGQKRSFEPQGDFATWHREHEMKKKTATAGQKESDDHTQATRGAKKYRKSAPVDQESEAAPTSEEREEMVQQEVKRRGRPAKTKEPKAAPEGRSSKLSGKSKERASAEASAKDQTKKKRRGRDRSESAETEKHEKVPEPEPETPTAPKKLVPLAVEVIEKTFSTIEEAFTNEAESPEAEMENPEESAEEEPPPPPPSPKSSQKTKSTDDTPPTPVSPKFQASAKESREASEPVTTKEARTDGASRGRLEDEESDEEEEDEDEPTQESNGHKESAATPELEKHGKHREDDRETEPPLPSVPHKVHDVVHKGSAKKPGESEKKKLAPKTAPRPSPPPSTAPSVKCSKYRKSCQDGSETVETVSKQSQHKKPETAPAPAHAPSAAAPAPKCNKYRKDCNAANSEGATPSKVGESLKHAAVKVGETLKVAAVKEAAKIHAAPAPQGKKCNKYRKDCRETEDAAEAETVKKTPSRDQDGHHKAHKEHREHKEHKEVHAAKHKHAHVPTAPVTTPVKCNKYRKDCQQATHAAVESKPVEQHRKTKDHDSEPEPVVVEKAKCTKYSYRISCRGQREDDDDDKDEKPQHVKKTEEKRPEIKTVPAPSYVAPKSGKCNKYRKDCQQSDESQATATVKAPEVKAKSESKHEKPSKPSESHASTHVVPASGKCNKYRKDCQRATEEAPVHSAPPPPPRVTEKHKTPAPPSSVPVAPSTGGSCNKYRKSCRESPPSESSKPEPHAKHAAKVKSVPAAKDESKPKKLCKKNTTATTNPAAKKDQQKKGVKAAPAPASAQVQQNKWRKPKPPPTEQLISS